MQQQWWWRIWWEWNSWSTKKNATLQNRYTWISQTGLVFVITKNKMICKTNIFILVFLYICFTVHCHVRKSIKHYYISCGLLYQREKEWDWSYGTQSGKLGTLQHINYAAVSRVPNFHVFSITLKHATNFLLCLFHTNRWLGSCDFNK